MELTPSLCRAARGLLGWSQETLAQKARIARATLADFEGSVRTANPATTALIVSALELGGVEFLTEDLEHGAGCRHRLPVVEYEGDPRAIDDGVMLRARFRGRRYRVWVGSAVLDDMIRGQCDSDDELVEAANRFLPVIKRAGEIAIVAGQGGDGYTGMVNLTHQHFDPRLV